MRAAGKRLCFLGSDIYIECAAAALRMGEALGGRGEVALIGVVDRGNAEAQIKNRMLATHLASHYPQIEISETAGAGKYEIKDAAYSITRDCLTRHPGLSGIYSNADEAMAGIARALEEAGIAGRVCLVGYGNEPQIMQLVQRGVVSFALLHNRFAYGHDSIVHLYNTHVAGRRPPRERMLVLPELASRENIADFWNPYSGYLVSDAMRRSLARPVDAKPARPLRFVLQLEGVGNWFPPLIDGARAAERALLETEVVVQNYEITGLTQGQLDERRAELLVRALDEGFDGVVLWVLNEAILPQLERVMERGMDVVVFHTEPVNYDDVTPQVEEIFSSLFEQLRRRERAEAKLAQLAVMDELTGLYNRRRFNRYAEQEWRGLLRAAWQRAVDVSVVLLDLDGFKAINDGFGHLVGDACLAAVGARILESIRPADDFAARYGGEEFAVVLPETGLEAATEVAERIRAAIAGTEIDARGRRVSVSASVGVATLRLTGREDREAWTALLRRADQALYAAKAQGGNAVALDEQLS